MKKLFFFIPALLLSLLANAAVINITPTSPYDTHDNLRLALYYANSGDEIVLADGTYDEHDNYLYFDKDITVRAANGASPVIAMYTYAQIKNGANVTISGLKFNGEAQGSYSYYIRFYDNSSTSLSLNGCEFYNIKNYVIYGNSSSHTNSLIVNNCYFHNNVRNAIYFEASGTEGVQTCDRLEVRNTTIANTDALTNYTSTIDIRPYGSDLTDAIKVIVDHCTFYNNPTINSDHSAIRPYKISDVTISNCIFAHPEAYERRATCCYGGTISNCLTFNLTTDAGQNAHRQSGGLPAFSGNFTADPLFTNAATGDFSLAGNWVTMALSPARGAATDGSDLGDPRWYTAETLPSTNFASTYELLGNKAQLNGNIELNASDHIKYKGSQVPGTAKWKLHITKECAISAVADRESGSTSGCTLTLTVYDADGNEVDATTAARSDNDNDISIGNLYIPEEGDYTIVLSNSVEYSGAILEKITLSYVGGTVQNIASAANTTIDVSEAWYSAGGSRADGKISFPGNLIATSWIRWNVHVAESKYYDVTVNFESDNGHNLGVRLFNNERNIAISEGGQTDAASPRELGRLSIPAGDYTMEVTNPVSYSHAQFISVIFAPVAASATTLPGTMEFGNAVLSDRAHVTDGKLYFAPIGDTNPVGEWASWTVTTDHNGTFLFTMGVNSTNGQSYKISIYDDTDNLIDAFEKKVSSNTAATIKHYFSLAAGNYSVKVENTTAWSRGYLTSLVVTEPSILTIDETATTNSVINDNYRLDAQDIQIIRTITAGMYNTICLPFDVSDADLKATFGNDVELLQMASATIDGTVLDLNFENVTTGIYRGTPYLIKTSRDIVNPIFVDATIKEKVGQVTSGTAANFIGTFIKTIISEDPNNLFLGANNNLYFPKGGDMPIKGMRAYFAVTGSSGAPVRQARIVAQGNVATEVELINGQLPSEFGGNDLRKSIENGQLIIIRDGVQYNALGVRVK